MRRLRRKRRKMRQRARQHELIRFADPWKMEGEDDGDWEVFEEIVDYWDDGDGDYTAEAAAAFEKELAEFEAAESDMSHVSMSDSQAKSEMSSSATNVDLSNWFLVTFPVWYLS